MAAQPETPPVPEPDAVELIVHGVSGVAPEAVLRCPIEEIERKGGTASAGFYRRRSDEGPQGRPRVKEAFSWGGLTSGPASRALWFLFLPFILINLANWMLPPAKNKTVAAILISLLRLLALSLTVTILLTAASVCLDMAGWQCAGLEQCSDRLGPAQFLAHLPTRGAQLAVTALPVALLIGALWYFGRSSAPYGAVPDPAVTRSGPAPLSQENFWNRDRSVDRLRACHLAVAFSGLGALTLFAPWTYARGSDRFPFTLLIAAHVAVIVIAVIATAWNPATARGGRGVSRNADALLSRVLWPVSLGFLVISLLVVFFRSVNYPNLDLQKPPVQPSLLPGLYPTILYVLAIQIILILLIFAFTAASHRFGNDRRNDDAEMDGFTPTLKGLTAPWVVLLAWFIGGGLSTGLGLFVARFLGNPVPSDSAAQCAIGTRQKILGITGEETDRLFGFCHTPAKDAYTIEDQVHALAQHAPLILPPQYYAVAVANLCVIIAVIVTGAALFVAVWIRARSRRTDIAKEYGLTAAAKKSQRVAEIARSQELAAVPDWAPNVLAGLLIFALADLVYWAIKLHDVSTYSEVSTPISWSQAITAFLAAAFVGLIFRAFRDRNTRRSIAVVWDVITFWPQAAHPLGPPCYGEIAVPALRQRVSYLTGAKSKVILSSHSQGTIIAAAMLMQTMVRSPSVAGGTLPPTQTDSRMPVEDRQDMSDRVAFLTFGSPLRKLYARNFPAYFGRDVLELLDPKQKHRWINLWVPTDPIGGWVFQCADVITVAELPAEPPDNVVAIDSLPAATVDARLHDVEQFEPPPGTEAPICGHSGFWTRQEYTTAVAVLHKRLVPDASPPAQMADSPMLYAP
jgi:hypothetical protein